MICEKCGAQNPDNTRICNQCGMPLKKNDTQNTVKKEEPEVKTSKNVVKKKSLLLIIGIPLAVYLIGRMAGGKIAQNLKEEPQTPPSVVEDVVQKQESGEEKQEDNPEYTKIFTERNIIKAPLFTIAESASFAKVEVDEDGMETVECLDFTYNEDTGMIQSMTETVYISIKDLTQDEVQAADVQIQAENKKYEELENFTASYEIGNQYYQMRFELKNLNDESVVRKFEEQGLLTSTTKGEGLLGIVPTENSLLEQGYVKK